MRVTNNMMVSNMMRNLNNNMRRLDKQQNRLATGKNIQYASDDPIIASKALRLRNDLSELEQYKRNNNDALSWLEISESAIADVGDVLQRARELTVQAANTGTLTTEETEKIAGEMAQLQKQLIASGNTTYAGRYVFSGYNTDQKLLSDDGTYNIDVTSYKLENKPTTIYEIGIGDDIQVSTNGLDIFGYIELNGAKFIEPGENTGDPAVVASATPFTNADIANGDFDDLKIMVTLNGERKEIQLGSGMANSADLQTELNTQFSAVYPGLEVTATVNGADPYTISIQTPGGATDTLKVDVVKVKESQMMKDFDDAIDALNSGDQTEISNFLGKLDNHINKSLAIRADIGARVNRMELVKERIDEDVLSFTNLLSLNEDADIAEVIMKLKQEENVYKASLSAGARVIQPTLLDFIR